MPSIIVGKPDVEPDLPSHVNGVREGNWPKLRRRSRMTMGKDPVMSGAPRRSTGISPSHHKPIDLRMPQLTPP